MEADWAVEVGADLPSIEVPWEGFVDLRRNPGAVVDIEEAIGYSALRQALIALNSSDSPVFTSKCDVWTLAASEIDPDEFGAQAADAITGCASYIDMVLRDRERLSSFDFQERQVRDLALQMRRHIVSNGRVDLTLRAANVDSSSGYGITLHAAGCGADAQSAEAAWQAVLRVAIATTMRVSASHGMGE
jgi:hypothetical protein